MVNGDLMRQLKTGRRYVVIMFCVITAVFSPAVITSAPLTFEPFSKKLPDGTVMNIFMSGDEFFNYLHDSNGFPLTQGSDGYYYYLIQNGDNFVITSLRFGSGDPSKVAGIKKVTVPSFVAGKRTAFYKKTEEEAAKRGIKAVKSSGTFNNLVIYIRFLNESAFTLTRSVYESRLNNLSGSSMRYYYREVSYGKLDVVSYSFPGGATSDICYTDSHPRSYFQPYNATTNTNGYQTDNERATREHSLLASAVNWAKSSYSLPAGVNFDSDGNGVVDNVCFVIKGSSDGWNDLLWPHRWSIYSQTVTIENMKVYGYTLQLENVSVNTLCHEMFHSLGAPDLYHYNNTDVPVGPWDIMASGVCHMGAWMKYYYGGWIPKIPEIKESGTYTIKALDKGDQNCWLIRSPLDKTQFFVLEYRRKSGLYENNLPASGLIIQRIDTRYRGNSNGPPDEVYIFRLNGTPSSGGTINSACLSDLYNRTAFSDYTNPYSFFQEGTPTRIKISNIISRGDSMLFNVEMDQPYDLVLAPQEDNAMSVSWGASGQKEYLVAVSGTNELLTPLDGTTYLQGDKIGNTGKIIYKGTSKSFLHQGLISDENYFYSVWTILSSSPSKYSLSVTGQMKTGIFSTGLLPYEQGFEEITDELPRGWKATSGTSGWQLNTENAYSPPASVLLKSSGSQLEEWLYSPGFSLISGNAYMVSFRYKNLQKGISESLTLYAGINRTETELVKSKLFSSMAIDYSQYAVYKAIFKPSASKTYYLGFRKPTGGNGVLIDDFKIEKVPVETKTRTKPQEFYPNPTTGKITVPATGKVKISVFSSDGTRLYETTIEAMQIVDLSFLGKGIFLIKFENDTSTTTGKIIIL
jgi:M6 family metalloprotease-like protein